MASNDDANAGNDDNNVNDDNGNDDNTNNDINSNNTVNDNQNDNNVDEKKEQNPNNPNNPNSSNDNNSGQIVAVAGATGAVGRYCIYLLVRDPRVNFVYAISRSDPKTPDFYGLSTDIDPINKLKHLKIDYTKDIQKQFNLHDNNLKFTSGLSCLGVYTADVKNVDDFIAKEYKPNLAIAHASALLGASSWSYLSGQGVYFNETSKKKKWSQPMFSWVKGLIEKDLKNIKQFNNVTCARPGFIFGRPTSKQMSGISGAFEGFINNHFPSVLNTRFAVHRDDIAKAMVNGIINQQQSPFVILENEEIKVNAKKYDLFSQLQ